MGSDKTIKKSGNTIRAIPYQQVAVGRTIRHIHRLLYVFADGIDWGDGALQLTFTDGGVLLLDGSSDGESLKASRSPWVDAFSGKLNEKNRDFIRHYGKWSLADVSDLPPYHSLVGMTIDTVRPIFNPFNTLCGVQISADGQDLNFVVEADECHILCHQDIADRGYVIADDNSETMKA